MAVAAILGTYIYAGLTTLLNTQTTVGGINSAVNLYSINSGVASGFPADVAMFQPASLGQGTGALGAGIGFGAYTIAPLLHTLTGSTSVWYNPNTTSVAGYILQPYFFSGIR
jgi:hypothetical protein